MGGSDGDGGRERAQIAVINAKYAYYNMHEHLMCVHAYLHIHTERKRGVL